MRLASCSAFPLSIVVIGCALTLGGAPLAAQAGGAESPRAGAGRAADASPFTQLKWRSIGPANTSGRIDDFAVARVPGLPDAIYVATASSGVFKSTNAGTSWTPVFDNVDAMMSIGAIAVAPSSPSTVWVGTGEANNRQSSSWGDGVYKSIDAGRSWQRTGLKDTRSIGRIVVDPSNADVVYVAAVGHLWGPNAERGVFKTSDGGKNWHKVLYVDANTGANDIAIDPRNPRTLYASTYQRQRSAWGFNGGGPGSGIWRSTDAGETWTRLGKGLPAGDKGRIGLDIFRGDGRVVYATVEAGGAAPAAPAAGGDEGGGSPRAAGDGGVFRSVDGGESWERLSTLNPRPSYYSQVRIDPKDRSRIYLLGSNRGFYVSDDSGRTFKDTISVVHSEDHALWVDPDDPNHLILGGDGGVSISWDRGKSWLFRDNMPLGQFYEVGVDDRVPYTVCGGLQDNGVWCVPSAVRDRNGISNRDAWNIGGGDGFYAEFDPSDPKYVYEESQNGNITRVNIETLERQPVKPAAGERPTRGQGGYRWNWDTPLVISRADQKALYLGANVLFKSTDRGSSWRAISPDLTAKIDRDTLEMMGARVTARTLSRHDGQSSYGSLTAVGESPLDARVLYTGSDDGQLQVTRDGGKSWTNITSRVTGLPAYTYVSAVVPSRHVVGRVYATFDGHYRDDYQPYVYVSDDYGQSWHSLAGGLPETSINRIVEHPRNMKVLVLGHERGAHVSNDGGATWTALTSNLPTVAVDDAVFQTRDNALVLGTHGRGIWILDDASPLEALTAAATRSGALLLPTPRARLWVTHEPQAWFGYGEFFAPNPEWGGVVSYWLREAATDAAVISIVDATGTVIRSLTAPAKAGLNRVVWDLRLERPMAVDSARDSSRAPAAGGRPLQIPTGPLVLPGTYGVSVKIPGLTELKGQIVVDGDPIVDFAQTARRGRQTSLLALYDVAKSLGEARKAVRTLSSHTEALKRGSAADSAKAPVDSLAQHVARLRVEIDRQIGVAGGLSRAIEGFSGLPTIDQGAQVEVVFQDAGKTVQELNRVIAIEVPAATTSSDSQLKAPEAVRPPTRRK